jgi:parvulin-like peptidyl-prolyl isomerase
VVPESVRASHILVHVPDDATADEREAARTRAAGLLDQLRRGADFAGLAQDNSDDAVSASNGGRLGELTRGQVDPALEAAAFALKPGGLSEVVATSRGFHVINVDGYREAGVPPLDEIRGDISERLA